MGEAKRRQRARLQGVGPTMIRPSVEYDVAMADMEHWIESGMVRGFVQIAKLEDLQPGLAPMKVWTFSLEKQEIYDLVCIVKRSMEETMGFKEQETSHVEP